MMQSDKNFIKKMLLPGNFDLALLPQLLKASGYMDDSTRQYQLLEYIVKANLNNTVNSISAYGIGVDICGRPTDFNNRQDSIVRTEMHRLRKTLKNFSTEHPFINIKAPAGTYRIHIEYKFKIKLPFISKLHHILFNQSDAA